MAGGRELQPAVSGQSGGVHQAGNTSGALWELCEVLAGTRLMGGLFMS